MEYIINEQLNGKTIRDILRYDIGLSMAFVRLLKFSEQGILLNGEHATVRKIVKTGDVLSLAIEDSNSSSQLTPTDIPLDIVFENEKIIIPNKPPFMPTHPSILHHGDTLADALAFRFQQKNQPFVFRPVNRLDRNTSGLTIIAKDRMTASFLSAEMREGNIKKQYVAILCGELKSNEGIIETHLTRINDSIITRRVCGADEGGDLAITHYKVLSTKNGYSLVIATPKTGRTHQLRVHFTHIGHPIVGDDMYGTADLRIARHALHAVKLSFPDPAKKDENILVCAPLPKDMADLASKLFADSIDEIYTNNFGLS